MGLSRMGALEAGKKQFPTVFYHVNHAEVVPLEGDLESTRG